MRTQYRLRRALKKVVHETENYLLSTPVLGEELEVLEKKSERVLNPSPLQRGHLQQCRDALAEMFPIDDEDAPTEPLDLLIEDFANALFHNGQCLERAFFKLSPKSRAYSALARAGLDEACRVESDDPYYEEW